MKSISPTKAPQVADHIIANNPALKDKLPDDVIRIKHAGRVKEMPMKDYRFLLIEDTRRELVKEHIRNRAKKNVLHTSFGSYRRRR